MPVYQVTWDYKSSSAGWSESLFRTCADHTEANLIAVAYVSARMRLMGVGIVCTAIRTSNIAVLGDAILDEKYRIAVWTIPADANDSQTYFKTTQDKPADMPWTALKVRFNDANGINVGNMNLRGLPDDWFQWPRIFIPGAAWTTAFTAWKEIVTTGWSTYITNKPTPAQKKRIEAITAPGNAAITITAPLHGLAVNDRVYIGKVETTRGVWFGDFQVSEVPTLNTFKIFDTTTLAFTYVKKGYVRKKEYDQELIKSVWQGKPSMRKPGRPSDSPVGRRSKRVSIQ